MTTQSRFSTALFIAAGALLYLSFGYTEMQGSDMWWHIAAGRELVQTGSLWMVDDWSFSAHGKDWHNHEWLSDLIYYGWVSLWGVESLVYWKWLVIVCTYAILQQALSRICGSQLAALVCAGVAAAIAAPFLDVRPHLYSLLMFSLLLYLLLGRRPRTVVLTLVFLVWVNLHGGFFFGLMALAILLFPWRDLSLANFRGALLVGVVCLLACVLNPSGVGAFLYPLKYAFDDSSPFRQLGEWLSPFESGGIRSPLFFTFMWAPAAALFYLLPPVRKSVGVPWEGIALTALTLAMSLTSRRFIPLFGMSLAVLLAPLLGLVLQKLKLHRFDLGFGAVALVFAVYRMLPYPLSAGPAFHYLVGEYSYPVDTLNFVVANRLQGKVYAVYNWGGYIHWRTDGDLKVFIDGRADTIYDDATYNHYVNVLSNRPGWLPSIERSGADYILWSYMGKGGQQKLKELLATGRWKPIYRDSVSWLLAGPSVTLPAERVNPPATPWYDMSMAQISAWSGDTDSARRFAQKTRAAMPWHRNACTLLASIERSTGQDAAAQEVLADCRSYFPSYLLR